LAVFMSALERSVISGLLLDHLRFQVCGYLLCGA
jgi:hypothetical protein